MDRWQVENEGLTTSILIVALNSNYTFREGRVSKNKDRSLEGDLEIMRLEKVNYFLILTSLLAIPLGSFPDPKNFLILRIRLKVIKHNIVCIYSHPSLTLFCVT